MKQANRSLLLRLALVDAVREIRQFADGKATLVDLSCTYQNMLRALEEDVRIVEMTQKEGGSV